MCKQYQLEKFDSGMHYIMLDAATVKKFFDNGTKRVICTLNNLAEFHCAIMRKKEGGHFINIGAAVCKKLHLKTGAVVSAIFKNDATEYQFTMPEELREVLNTDAEADKLFHRLTEGNQRGLMYLVTQVKSPDKRIERSLKIAERIKHGLISPRLVLK